MKSVIKRITLFTTLIFILFASSVYGATERRTALVIGNSSYTTGSLANPVNDADDMASALKSLGFDVILKKDATQRDMEEAIRNLGNRLKKGGVGLFFYAGHGVQVAGKNYIIPLGARIEKETDVKYEAVDADMVLDEMGNAGNSMNIVILDACRDNPFGKSFRSSSRGLAIISSAPRGTLVSYSTSPSSVAADGGGRNSPYTGSLMKHMMTPGLPIEEVFKSVRQDLGRQTGGKQIPWELSSLEGRFYFTPQGGKQNNLSDVPSYSAQAGSDELAQQKAALERERVELLREKQGLERQKALDYEREQLAAERRKIEAERQQLAMGKRPSVSTTGETARDARFIANDNGTVFVLMETSLGNVKLELFAKDAPISVKNFLNYVDSGFYNGTIYHRVIPNFMIQGGGFTVDLKQKQANPPIKNEADNGLKNLAGTLAMARTAVIDSATAQFFINLVDNGFLNHRDKTLGGYGYAVFGKVSEGMDVVAKIGAVKTVTLKGFRDVPEKSVVIKSIKILP